MLRDALVAFSHANAQERKAASKNAAGRAALARSIARNKKAAKRQLKDAVGTMNRSLLALKVETAKKIKKSNHKVTAYADALAKEAKDVDAAMKANMNALTAKVSAARRSAKSAINAANAKSAAGFRAALKSVNGALVAARHRASNKFGKLYRNMAKQRASADSALSGAVKNINDGIAKQAALADSRFSKTVKNIAAARAQSSKQVSDARKTFATSIARTVASVKDQETRLSGEIAVVSGEVARNRAIQLRVNRRTNAELARITKLSNLRHSASIRARGKLRALLDENKRAASEEVNALNKLFVNKLSKIRRRAATDRIEAARDLSKASQRLYAKLANIQLKAAYGNKSAAAIRTAKTSLNARLNTLGNVIAANSRKVEAGFEVLTGVIRSHKSAGKLDRKLIREQTKSMGQDMQKAISRAIMIGEAKARRVADRARGNLAREKRAMLVEISERVENAADNLFKTIQGSHKQIADNYLSLKAYAVTAGDKLKEYVIKSKGKNLSSLRDLLSTVAGLSHVKAVKAEGVGAGASKVPAIFTAKNIKVDNSVNKINGLVNEYSGVTNAVRARWPMGLGKYLLLKLEESMLGKGALQVDKVSNHAGNFVFLNGRAVGLSNKLNDFESLAVRMGHYEATLAKLTASLAGKKHSPAGKKPFAVSPPEWPGN